MGEHYTPVDRCALSDSVRSTGVGETKRKRQEREHATHIGTMYPSCGGGGSGGGGSGGAATNNSGDGYELSGRLADPMMGRNCERTTLSHAQIPRAYAKAGVMIRISQTHPHVLP